MPLSIRPSTPRDLTFLAEACLHSARGHTGLGFWDLVFPGSDEVQRRALVERVLVTGPRSWCHHSSFLVAELDGEPAAAIARHDPGAPDHVRANNVLNQVYAQFGFSERAVDAAAARLAPLLACTPDDEPGALVLEWGATRPELRRRGAMLGLLEAAVRRSIDDGHERLVLTTFVDNLAAQRVLERAGFKRGAERRSAGFQAALGAPGLVVWRLDASSA